MTNSQDWLKVFGWIAVAVTTAFIVFCAIVFQTSSGFDAAPGEGGSYCTTGPTIGVRAVWIVTIVGGVIIVFSVIRAVLIGRRRPAPQDRDVDAHPQ
jgi:hypothetical protein